MCDDTANPWLCNSAIRRREFAHSIHGILRKMYGALCNDDPMPSEIGKISSNKEKNASAVKL